MGQGPTLAGSAQPRTGASVYGGCPPHVGRGYRRKHGDLQRGQWDSSKTLALSPSGGTGCRLAHGSRSQYRRLKSQPVRLLDLPRAEPYLQRHWALYGILGQHHRLGGAGTCAGPPGDRWLASHPRGHAPARSILHASRRSAGQSRHSDVDLRLLAAQIWWRPLRGRESNHCRWNTASSSRGSAAGFPLWRAEPCPALSYQVRPWQDISLTLQL